MNFFKELQRRNVYRVAIAYLVTAWLIAQVADLALAAFGAPPWVQKTLLFLLALGFPIACLLAWAYELTPEGVRRSADAADANSAVVGGHKTLDLVIIGLLTVAVVVLATDRFLPSDAGDQVDARRAGERPSVAILPFVNRSAVDADAFFVDGVHEDLLRQIATIGSIKTISRTSVLQYRDSGKSAPEIAAELDVNTILEGGVQRSGNRVRINVQLIDAGTDEYLWTESYQRELSAENIFSIQGEIATAVASALQAALSSEERDDLAKVPTTNIDALNAFFSGRRRMETRRPDELEIAVSEFEKAVALDPNFALAYVALADTYRLLNNYGDLPPDVADAKGQAAVDKALELDDRLGEAYASLANLRRRGGDYDGAEQAFVRGIELNPNYAPLYQWYGEFLAFNVGQPREAVGVSQKSVALDPKSAIINRDYAAVLNAAGQFEQALEHYRVASELDPDAEFAFEGEGVVLRLGLSRMGEAIAAFRKENRADPDDPWPLFGIATTLLDLGDPEQSAEIVARIAKIAPGSEPHTWAILLLELYRGNDAEAREAADRLRKTWPENALALRVLRDSDIDGSEAVSARARYEEFANLQIADRPDIHPNDVTPAVDYACLLDRMGESHRASAILRASLEAMRAVPRLGLLGYNVTDVRALTLLGNRRAALDALQEAYEDGWRVDWWLELERDRCLADLRDEPEFKAVVDLIREDMRRQRAVLDVGSL
jgi:TolB-like protein/Tfp pilus assembly protein PilF